MKVLLRSHIYALWDEKSVAAFRRTARYASGALGEEVDEAFVDRPSG